MSDSTAWPGVDAPGGATTGGTAATEGCVNGAGRLGIDAGPEGVTDLRFVMNPDKLAFAAAQLSRIGGLPDLSW